MNRTAHKILLAEALRTLVVETVGNIFSLLGRQSLLSLKSQLLPPL
jgi:hypothetical protein